MAKNRVFDIVLILQIVLAVFFIILGVEGLVFKSSDITSVGAALASIIGGKVQIYVIILSVIEIVCGVVLLSSLFAPIGSGFINVSIIIAFVLWALVIVFKDFIGSNLASKSTYQLIIWIRKVVVDVIILMSVWLIRIRRNI